MTQFKEENNKKVFSKSAKFALSPIMLIGSTISLFIVAQFFASIFILLIFKVFGIESNGINDRLKDSALAQFMFVLTADILIILGVWIFLRKRKHGLKEIGFARPKLNDFWLALGGYIFYVILFLLVTFIAKKIFPTINLDQEQQIGFKSGSGILNLVFAFISLVVLPPIVEEILCRGYLYTSLRRSFSFIVSAIITSLVFAAAHLQFGSNAPLLWIAAIDTFILSMVLVFLREKTKHLAAPMLLHGTKNLVAFMLLFVLIK